MVIHIVLFRYRLGADPGAIERLQANLAGLSGAIPAIGRYQGGTNVSPEGRGHDYDWGFVMTFPDAGARDAYLDDPAHLALHPLIGAVVEDVLVYDLGT